jgi:acetyltransferase-like isoleucine patch superfamily enzyme
MPPESNSGGRPAGLKESLSLARDMPWKAANELRRLLTTPYARLYVRSAGVRWGRGWRLYGVPVIQRHRRSELLIGDRLELRSTVHSNPLGPNRQCILTTREPGAKLVIGSDFGMTGGSVICAQSVTIGDRVIVGSNTIITDTDFHPLDAERRRQVPQEGATAPLVIEDDVFIGMNVLILKGVRLGAGCVVGAGSVVTGDVPAEAVVAGNPARIVRPGVNPQTGTGASPQRNRAVGPLDPLAFGPLFGAAGRTARTPG